LGDAAATGAAPGVPPAIPAAGVGDEGPAGCELSETFSCFLHIEKFSARSKGRMANRIIIKELKPLSGSAKKTSGFCVRSPGNTLQQPTRSREKFLPA
jgi:hypothetical protein